MRLSLCASVNTIVVNTLVLVWRDVISRCPSVYRQHDRPSCFVTPLRLSVTVDAEVYARGPVAQLREAVEAAASGR